MQNAFYEESATAIKEKTERKYYKVFQIMSILTFILAGILAIASFYVIPSMVTDEKIKGTQLTVAIIIWVAVILVVLLMGYLFMRLKRRFNCNYDYTFVEDEIRITRVFNGLRRKPLVVIKTENILKFGYMENPSYERTLAGNGKPVICTPNAEPADGKQFVYLLATTKQGKCVYILECRTMLLEYIIRAAGRSKFERE